MNKMRHLPLNALGRKEMEERVPFEIERKFLIKMPREEELFSIEGAFCDEIIQTYLLCEKGLTHRVRRRIHGEIVTYTETKKIRVTDLRCVEEERELEKAEYEALLKNADPLLSPIRKKRYCIPYGGRLLEVDVYPFWQKSAILEVELPSEETAFSLPPYLSVLREVSGEVAYKNLSLAKSVPIEPFGL